MLFYNDFKKRPLSHTLPRVLEMSKKAILTLKVEFRQ